VRTILSRHNTVPSPGLIRLAWTHGTGARADPVTARNIRGRLEPPSRGSGSRLAVAAGAVHLTASNLFINNSVVQSGSCSNLRSSQQSSPGARMELLTAFEGAVASTAEIIKATPTGQMDAPTPCPEW